MPRELPFKQSFQELNPIYKNENILVFSGALSKYASDLNSLYFTLPI